MKEHLTTLTRKGQITLPAEVRQAMGLRRGDRLAVVLENGQAIVKRSRSVIARTAGVVRCNPRVLTAEELRDVAEEAWAQHSAHSLPGREVGQSADELLSRQ